MKKLITSFLSLLLVFNVFGQAPKWSPINSTTAPNDVSWQSIRKYSKSSINLNQLSSYLINLSPAENTKGNTIALELPWIDGSMRTYQVMESAVMESEIASRYPEIKTYKGTDGINYLRLICTPNWMKAYILTEEGDVIIEPLQLGNSNNYGIYHSSDIINQEKSLSKICGESGRNILKYELPKENWSNQNIAQSILGANPISLITYRIAVSCTGEFGQTANLGGGSIPSIIAKIVDALVYANAVYEKDFAIHFNMVNSNDKIVFLDPDTDPFDNIGQGGYLLGQNTRVVNSRIGTNFYDFGHVFNNTCSDVGGIANLGVICSADSKANGVTCWYNSDVAYVAQRIFCHEMGHQFSASHTFSNCNGNESGTRYEPGGGTSIMSYQGLCGLLNIEGTAPPHPNFFHSCSIEQVINFTRNVVTCGTKTNPNNSYPQAVVLTKQNLVLPIKTPFELRGSGNDMEDTTLTYNWEQFDNGPYGDVLGAVSSTGPLFRTFFPSKNPNRTIPQWSSIFNAPVTNPNYDVKEFLPIESRNLNFRYVVRDNHPGAGGTSYSSLKLKVTDQAGPFKVTFPNSTSDRLIKNACNKIKWDVANTFNVPVNCKKVDILMFKNREFDKPIMLKANTDNDGIELVDIPDIGTNVRVKIWVRAADHIFFDISDRDIQIIDATTTGVNMGVTPNVVNVCLPQLAEVKIKSCSFGGFKGNLNVFIESGLPVGSSYTFGKTNLTEDDETTLILDINNLTTKSTINLIIAAITPNGDTLRDELLVNAIKNDFSDQQLLFPINGARNVLETPVFHWVKSINSNVYTFEIATSPAFGNSVFYSQDNITVDTLLLPVLLKENKIYYWRIIPINACGNGTSSNTNALQTTNKACVDQAYTGNPVGLFASKTHTIKIPINFNGTISDINFNNADINADAVRDVVLSLISPSGTRVKLFNANCGIVSDFQCSFDDEAPIALECPPRGGKRMRPFEPLSKFNGESLQGNWTLELVTSSLFRDGVIKDFTLQYCAELKINNPNSVLNGPLRMNVGETKGIGNDLLLSQDPDNSSSELLYTVVSIPGHGNLLFDGNLLTYGNTFSQKDIDDGRLTYQHTGTSAVVDAFSYTVNDGQGGWYGVSNFDIFVGAVATKDENLSIKLKIYPNPTKGVIDIFIDDFSSNEIIMKIIDLQGRIIRTIDLTNTNHVNEDLSNLNNGVYFVYLKTKDSNITKKLIINK
ncbi:MAG: reprolysin-like metallopeptidase [Saprospiraceae bacterium]